MSLTILEGSTFCVCDERGDVDGTASASGFFAADTRFLSRSVLTLGGRRPQPLSHAQPAPHLALFVLRQDLGDALRPELAIQRERFVGDEMEERIVVENLSRRPIETELALELAADFADIFSVKALDPDFGNPASVTLPPPRAPSWDAGENMMVFADDGFEARTFVHLSVPCGESLQFRLRLEPAERWELVVGVQPLLGDGEPLLGSSFARRIEQERTRAADSYNAWRVSAPRLRSSWDDLVRTWDTSVADLGALRMRTEGFDFGPLPAAGSPWFMTVFGRDTLITCLQTLTFGPELSESALRVLAATQAREDDPERDAEPGKIIHEFRRGKAAALGWTGDRYYGTADATPLFLVLLSELWRWTGDDALVLELEDAARRALAWLDGPGDPDGDGFVEYSQRASHGMRNQNWKDSEDGMVFHDGSLAVAPIAAAEVQGYAYDAKLRFAELEREVWRDPAAADRLELEASELRQRFDDAFWLPAGYYALGLDGEKRPIDALGSNMGHLLWSGIVLPERVNSAADVLMSDRMWSGWGIRTLASDERAYNPLVYHNGTVWPHDNSLIAWGRARAGRARDAERILRRMIEAAAYFDYRLPEVFAGFPRGRTRMPVVYPTASRPQAWAAGTPILLLQIILGLRPNRGARVLQADADELPPWAEGLSLEGIHAFGRCWSVRVTDGSAVVDELQAAVTP